jgi:hypothetical protein
MQHEQVQHTALRHVSINILELEIRKSLTVLEFSGIQQWSSLLIGICTQLLKPQHLKLCLFTEYI